MFWQKNIFKKVFLVKVKPYSSQESVAFDSNNNVITVNFFKIPERGKANKKLITLLAEKFNIKENQITIKSGFTSSYKKIIISFVDENEYLQKKLLLYTI